MIAQLANIQAFVVKDLSDLIDWGKHVRPDPHRKTTGDQAYVLIVTEHNQYRISCLSSYVEPPSGAPYQCKALGTITLDDHAGNKHICAPKNETTWMEISKHLHVRELTDAIAALKRELAEASPDRAASIHVRLAELALKGEKWGVKVPGIPPVAIAQAAQWKPEEVAQARTDAAPIVTVADQREGLAAFARPDEFLAARTRPKDAPFIGAPILFITNPGESIAGMQEIAGTCVRVHTDTSMISAYITPDHSEPFYRDKLPRRSEKVRFNCWDINHEAIAALGALVGKSDPEVLDAMRSISSIADKLEVESRKRGELEARLDQVAERLIKLESEKAKPAQLKLEAEAVEEAMRDRKRKGA